jgi:hypothetical protein
VYDIDPFDGSSYRRVVNVQRPCTSPVEQHLLTRIATEGRLEIGDLTREEQAMLHVLRARGRVTVSEGAFVPVLMG